MPWMEISVCSVSADVLILDGIMFITYGIVNNRLYSKDKRGDRRKAEDLVHQMVGRALDMEGTCTGGTFV